MITPIWLLSGSGEIEVTEYHPFKSAEAKERWIRNLDELAKTSWPEDSDSVYIDTSFGNTFVRICGPESAPPLVLLHGAGTNSLMWSRNIRALSEKYRTYAVDTIDDHGLSVNSKLLRSADEYTEWLDELFSGLHLDNHINLVGLSYGGWLSGQYAIRHRDRLNKVVLLSPAGIVQPIRMQFYIRGVISFLPFRNCRRNLLSWVLEDLRKQDESFFETIVLYQMELARQCFKSYQIRTNPGILSDQELQNLQVPVLFLTGANEKIYSSDKAMERLERVAPSIEKGLFPGAGHDLFAVKAEMVNARILEFLGDGPR
jgi:pimeloyl-ACP methyl ester carboxylesterase